MEVERSVVNGTTYPTVSGARTKDYECRAMYLTVNGAKAKDYECITMYPTVNGAKPSIMNIEPSTPPFVVPRRSIMNAAMMWGKREFIYLSLHHQNDSCVKVGSDESHFNVSLIVRDEVTRQCPQTTTFMKR